MTKNFTATIREEEGSYWAEVNELPGCFASGDTLDELMESIKEAIALCLDIEPETPPVATQIQVSVAVPA